MAANGGSANKTKFVSLSSVSNEYIYIYIYIYIQLEGVTYERKSRKVTEMNSVIELQQVVELLTQSPLTMGRGLPQRTLDRLQPLRFCMPESRVPQMRMEPVQTEVHMEIDHPSKCFSM